MARRVFYSFHYVPDNWRAAQVRNMGILEGNTPAKDNDWETVKKGGDAAIKKWIDDQMVGRSCLVVLIGSGTAGRKWINYEIEQAWNAGKGVVGIYVHGLANANGEQSSKGKDPFSSFTITTGGTKKSLSTIVKTYDTPYSSSKYVYSHIKENLSAWIEEAVEIRKGVK